MEDKPLNCESEQAAAGAMFDAFCKEVLRNTIFNYKRKMKRQINREVITPDPEQYITARDAVFDEYETDHLGIEFEGSVYSLDNEKLYQSMLTLPKNLLGVLLHKFWHGQKDAIIASHFCVSTRTIRQWRSLAITEIRKWYQKKEVESNDTT
jgi:DNA-directed RNA polymerase specialized sigma24 family protein